VTVRKTRVEQMVAEGVAGARALARATRDPDSFVAACQLGITMASLGLGWVGEPVLVTLFEPAFGFLPPTFELMTRHVAATVVAFGLITFLHMILGEQMPKVAALQNPESL
jgi:CBS domain containing-hemolysin-like protein